jgi:hypothetical protein
MPDYDRDDMAISGGQVVNTDPAQPSPMMIVS